MRTPANDGAAFARAMAAQVIARVAAGRYLDAALDELWRNRPEAASERSLIQELCYGTLRWYPQLAAIARLFLARPLKARDADVHALLLLGLYQLRHMRVPPHAAVDTTVEAAAQLGKRWAKGVINACLRAALRDPQRIDDALAASPEARYGHPAWLIDRLRSEYPDAWERILAANNARPPMTLRVNLARIGRTEYRERLAAAGLSAQAHALVESALVLDAPVPVEQLPGFDEGLVSVQDAAAQLAAIWLSAQPGERVLDACAAPGGKAAHILERTPGLAGLTAIDIDAARLERVRDTLARLGLDARLVLADAANPDDWWDGVPFDRVLLDVPCSATGVIRRHPDIKVRRHPEDLAKLAETQARLLDGVWPCLAPGGKLLYVTCSLLSEENRLQVERFLARHPDAAAEPLAADAPATGRQILPGEDEMDGFFYACLRKV
ncbi:MAG TPA: 16S rRNA (cytosine(967)-C(5))-methyltransferase RsmB [Burkholderiales bacterium]